MAGSTLAMQGSPDTSAHSEAARIRRADGDFTKCKGDPWLRISPSVFLHPFLYPTGSARPVAGQKHRIAGSAQEGGTSCSGTGCGSWTCTDQRGLRWPQGSRDAVHSRQMSLSETSVFFSWAAPSDSPDVVAVPRHLESLESQQWVNTNLNKSQGSTSSILGPGDFAPFPDVLKRPSRFDTVLFFPRIQKFKSHHLML